MQKQLSRKHFLSVTALGAFVALEACTTAKKSADATAATPPAPTPAPAAAPAAPAKPPKPPALALELVKEFVGKAHSDFARVKELYAQEPRLLNAAFDHGGGDFETALEAAGHVGNADIANFLLDNGARMNIFCAAMLGKLEIVKAILTAFPELKNSKGPHGLMLIHHAKKGGERAKEVLNYLESIGAS